MIPPQSNVSEPWPVDWWLYKERHLLECFFQKLKWFCRITARYDKLDASFLAFVSFASIAILLIWHTFPIRVICWQRGHRAAAQRS